MTLQQQHLEAIHDNIEPITDNWGHYGGMNRKEATATACEAITIEHMGKFAEWASGNTYDMIGEQNEFGEELWENYSYEDQHSTPDLIKLYFESLKPKT